MILGIMQGRLSPPVDGAIQEFPKDWKKEFILLKGTGLCHIDWIVTKDSFKSNPLFETDLSILPIRSICADNLISRKFCEPSFLKDNLQPICEAAIKNKIYSVTIPLLEDSSIEDLVIRNRFTQAIKPYSKKYKNLIFSFEFECEPEAILQVVKNRKNFRITYDTGNITSYKNPCTMHHPVFIRSLIKYIDCIHLKDRTSEGKTVTPGKGDADFVQIMNTLIWIGYEGCFTMQTDRGKTGNELKTTLDNMKFFKKLFLNDTYR